MTTRRLLLVDDYPDALEMWAYYLRRLGFDVDTAADGLSALSLAESAKPDLIVMDLRLPGMSGYEATRRIRDNPVTAHIPIIATTGSTHPAELERARAAGCVAVMIKPCDPPLMVHTIEETLAARR